AVAGGTAGILLAFVSRRLLETFIPDAMKGTVAISFDVRVFVFAIGASFLAALLASATPVFHLLKSPLVAVLHQDYRAGTGTGSTRLRGALVISEVALTVALLSGAGLMVRSLISIWRTDLGFHPENLWTTRVSLPNTRYKNSAQRYQFYDQALEKIRAIP